FCDVGESTTYRVTSVLGKARLGSERFFGSLIDAVDVDLHGLAFVIDGDRVAGDVAQLLRAGGLEHGDLAGFEVRPDDAYEVDIGGVVVFEVVVGTRPEPFLEPEPEQLRVVWLCPDFDASELIHLRAE